jgi:hypothetical protein
MPVPSCSLFGRTFWPVHFVAKNCSQTQFSRKLNPTTRPSVPQDEEFEKRKASIPLKYRAVYSCSYLAMGLCPINRICIQNVCSDLDTTLLWNTRYFFCSVLFPELWISTRAILPGKRNRSKSNAHSKQGGTQFSRIPNIVDELN